MAIIGIIAAIAVPGLLRARMSGNEASAIGSMRAINTAQQNYSQQCNGYAPVLTELKAAGNYLSPDMTALATVAKSGYNISLAAGMGNMVLATQAPGCTASGTNYYATAVPLADSGLPAAGFDLEAHVQQIERGYLAEALKRAGGVQVKAAELLGMSFRSFRYYVKKYNLR